MSGGRYAIYFAPARESAWWEFGSRWLDSPSVEFAALTQEPLRYRFHATLKAPMRLADASESELVRRVDALAAALSVVPLGTLVPRLVEDFVALVPSQAHDDVDALAARCVRELDDLRAPLTDDELARRRPERLDTRQRELLARWGYPHVMERFRFHMTLTDPVVEAVAQRVIEHVQPAVSELNRTQPLLLDRLCIFHEPAPGLPFRRIHDAKLAR